MHQRIAETLLWLARRHVVAEGACRTRQAGLRASGGWREVTLAVWLPVGGCVVGVLIWRAI